MNELELVKIDNHHMHIFENLAQAYEAEFSNLTHKMPNELGVFIIDTDLQPPHIGFLLYQKKIPIGFCIASISNKIRDIAEFYIVPVMRKKNYGYRLAEMIFNKYPGEWQVRQIQGATTAIQFWRSTIKRYTENLFQECTLSDIQWGRVTCQKFITPILKMKSTSLQNN